MRLYELGTGWIVALLALGWIGYSDFTAQDIERMQQRAQTEYRVVKGYALKVKQKYVKAREDCRTKDGEWKDSRKCEEIKGIDPDAQKLWNELVELDKKLKKADAKADEIQRKMERLQAMKDVAVKIASKVNA